MSEELPNTETFISDEERQNEILTKRLVNIITDHLHLDARLRIVKEMNPPQEVLDEALFRVVNSHIRRNEVGRVIDIVDTFESVSEFTKSEDFRDFIEDRVEIFIASGEMESSSILVKKFQIPDDKLDELAKAALLKSVERGELITFNEIRDYFNISSEIVLEEDFQKAAKETLIRRINTGGNFDFILGAISEFRIPEEFFNSEEFLDACKNCFIKYITNLKISDAVFMLKRFKLDKSFTLSPEIQTALEGFIYESLSQYKIQEVLDSIRFFSISPEILSGPEIKNVAIRAVHYLYSVAKLEQAEELIKAFGLRSYDVIKSEGAQHAALEGASRLITKGQLEDIYKSEKILDLFEVSKELLQDFVVMKVRMLICEHEYHTAYILRKEYEIPANILSLEEMQNHAKPHLIAGLSGGSMEAITAYRDYLDFTDDFLSSPEFKDAAIDGVILNINVKMDIDTAKKIQKNFDIKNEELFDRLKESLFSLIQKGEMHYALKVKGLFDMPSDTLESEEDKKILAGVIVDMIGDRKADGAMDVKTGFDVSDDLIINHVKGLETDARLFVLLYMDIKEDPLFDFVKKLRQVIQFNPSIENETNNQWISDIIPLLSDLEKEGFAITEYQDEIIRSIKEIGPVNNVDVHVLSIKIQRGTLDDLDEAHLRGVGVKDFTLGNFRVAMDRFQTRILQGAMENRELTLSDSLNYGIFKSRFVLSSSWDRKTSQHDWIRYSQEDEYVIPEYLSETQQISFSVERIRKVDSKELEEYISSNQEFQDVVVKKRHFFAESIKFTFEQHIENFLVQLKDDLEEMEKLLSMSKEDEWEEYLQGASNELESEKREKTKRRLLDEKSRIGFLKQKDLVQKILAQVSSLEGDHKDIINAVSQIKEAKDLFLNLLVTDIFETKDLEGFKDQLVTDKEDVDEIKYANDLHEFLTHGLRDHYFKDIEDVELVESMKKSLGLVETSKGNTAIDLVKNKIQSLTKTEVVNTEEVSINIIPVANVARLSAGNIGDACYTSQVEEMHTNRGLDKVHAFLFGQKNQSGNISFKGSCLLVETVDVVSGETLFVIRANNPRENFIMSMSPQSRQTFVDETINAFRKYLSEYEKQTGKKAKLAIIGDQCTQSSTNRMAVYEAYGKYRKNGTEVTASISPATRFNYYDLNSKKIYEV